MKNREIIKGITGILFLFILAFLAGRFLAQAVDAVSSSSVLPAEGNWGLSFREDGKPPVANASFEELAKYNAFYAENTQEKVLYLTFDCGFENGNTPAILDALKKHNVKATFFYCWKLSGNQPRSGEKDVGRRAYRGKPQLPSPGYVSDG